MGDVGNWDVDFWAMVECMFFPDDDDYFSKIRCFWLL